MKGLDKKGVDAWNARADEVIKCIPVSKEREEEILSHFTPINEDEIEEILREYRS